MSPGIRSQCGLNKVGICTRHPLPSQASGHNEDLARDLFAEGICVIGFGFPFVPKGEARIRVQVSAAHTREHLDGAAGAFTDVGARYGVV